MVFACSNQGVYLGSSQLVRWSGAYQQGFSRRNGKAGRSSGRWSSRSIGQATGMSDYGIEEIHHCWLGNAMTVLPKRAHGFCCCWCCCHASNLSALTLVERVCQSQCFPLDGKCFGRCCGFQSTHSSGNVYCWTVILNFFNNRIARLKGLDQCKSQETS